MRLSDRELATVLAALRHWQEEFPDNMGQEEREERDASHHFYSDDGIDRSPLVSTEIDALIENTLNVKDAPYDVHVVTYDWRNWSHDVFVFETLDQAKQHVIDNANEARPSPATADPEDEEPPITDYDLACASLTDAGHNVNVDTLTVIPQHVGALIARADN